MSQLRVRAWLFSPLGEALVFGPAGAAEKNWQRQPSSSLALAAGRARGRRPQTVDPAPGRGAALSRILKFLATPLRNAMDRQKRTLAPERTRAAEPILPPFALIFGWIDAWFTTCRAYYQAAIAYEELYRLPEVELKRLDYTRATLARDVTGFDITHHPDITHHRDC
jgi:hypothetical protein